jgi:cytochrome P450
MNILLVAGHETTTSLTAWLLYLLSQNPGYLQRVLEELDHLLPNQVEPTLDALKQAPVLDNALSEAQRMYPPIGNGPRGTLEEFKFNGFLIPADTRIFYSIVATHLMPSIFAEPDRFDPDRFAYPREEHKKTPYALVGFGGGPRICLGINFAELEIKLIAACVLRQCRLDLVPGQKLVQVYVASGAPFKGIKMAVLPLAATPKT